MQFGYACGLSLGIALSLVISRIPHQKPGLVFNADKSSRKIVRESWALELSANGAFPSLDTGYFPSLDAGYWSPRLFFKCGEKAPNGALGCLIALNRGRAEVCLACGLDSPPLGRERGAKI